MNKDINAIGIVRQMVADGQVSQEVAEKYFPELKESNDDERIKQFLIHEVTETSDEIMSYRNMSKKDVLTWFEKQVKKDEEILILKDQIESLHAAIKALKEVHKIELKKQNEQKPNPCDGCINRKGCINCENGELREVEQKPVDKVEPKFKVGDWIYHNNGYRGPYLITNINEHGVELDNNIRIKIEDCYDYHHLWTIQDAKKGDVLCCESGWTCIFKSLNSNNVSFNSYCFMDKDGWFCERGSEGHTLEKSFIKAYNGNIYPATKEQRDLLFTKMKESGYEWDAEKKELKKIEQNPIDYKDELKKCRENPLYFFDKYVKLKERELNWSKEDERCYAFILSSLEEKYSNKGDVYTWFKSLKQRIGGE